MRRIIFTKKEIWSPSMFQRLGHLAIPEKKEYLGGVLIGERLFSASYHVEFRWDKHSEVLCKKTLKKEEVAKFRSVVQKGYYFEMYYDDLPIWGVIGDVHQEGKDPSDKKFYLYNRIHFDIFYNKDRVIEIGLFSKIETFVDLTEDKEIDVEFLYSAKWKEIDTPFEKRRKNYYLPFSSSHWFSIINSCVPILLLTGFLATIMLWVLKNDFVKYAHDEESAEGEEETGWKNLHGVVFRFPKYKSICSCPWIWYPTVFSHNVHIYFGVFWCILSIQSRGSIHSTCGHICVNFRSCWLHCNHVLLSARGNKLALPLLVLGGVVGKKNKAEFRAPCRTTNIPREIPPMPWYRKAISQVTVAGILPFGVMCMKLDYVFPSVWGSWTFATYNILFIVFTILLIVTAAITVALTYIQLAAEDYEWWWS